MSLLVDKVHLKSYFDYTGGNIIDLSHNSNEAATSTFAFMLSSVFSQYKDVAHGMPTKYLQAKNLFDIIKCMIIDLEIWLIRLESLTVNVTMNKKLYLSFVIHQSFQLYIPTQLWSLDLFCSYMIQSLECITKNWPKQKDLSKCMPFPKFCYNENHELDSIQSAPFCTL